MKPITHNDVGYAFLLVAQSAEVAKKLHRTDYTAEAVDKDATALLEVWGISDSDDVVDEVLGRLDAAVAGALGKAFPSAVWKLLARKLEVARVFLKAWRDEQAKVEATMRRIDEADEAWRATGGER